MRALLPALALVLFGCAAPVTAPDGDRELRITTSDEGGVVVDDPTGGGRPVVLTGPHVSIVLEEGVALRVDALDYPSVSAVFNEAGWITWKGSFEVEMVRGDEVKGRFRVRNATMVAGQLDGSEGWADGE